jgi:hypothetical protein
MKYTEEMILHSESGYCMPFEAPQGKEVEVTLGYGEQTDPGSRFFTMALTSTHDITGCLPSRAELCQGSAMTRYTGYARLSDTRNTR